MSWAGFIKQKGVKSGNQLTISRFFAPTVPVKRACDEEHSFISENDQGPSPKRPKDGLWNGKNVLKRSVEKLQKYSIGKKDLIIGSGLDHSMGKESCSKERSVTESLVRTYDLQQYVKNADTLPNKGRNDLQSRCKAKCNPKEPAYTPLERQFMDIKKEYPDSVLFVECGYKYRFFGDDAEIAAKELNIVAHSINNFMSASIPTHRLQVHLQRLVSKGYKVGVVKQTETAALKAASDNKSAPFTRELDALYTKATLFGDDLKSCTQGEEFSQPFVTSDFGGYILCISENEISQMSDAKETMQRSPLQKGRLKANRESSLSDSAVNVGVLAVQPSTGTIMYDNFVDNLTRAELVARLEMINPTEVVTNHVVSARTSDILNNLKTGSACSVRWEQVKISSTDTYLNVLQTFFGKLDTKPFLDSQLDTDVGNSETESMFTGKVSNLPDLVQCSLSLAVIYLKPFKLDAVLRDVSKFHCFTSGSCHMKLNGMTLRNLEIFKNLVDGGERGTLFWFMNHTCTPFGRRLLKKWVAKPLIETKSINERLDKIAELRSTWDLPWWSKMRKTMVLLPDLEKSIALIQYLKASPQDFLRTLMAFDCICKEFAACSDEVTGLIRTDLRHLFIVTPKQLEPIVTKYINTLDTNEAKKGDKTKLFKDKSNFPELCLCLKNIDETLFELQAYKTVIRKTLRSFDKDYVTVSGNEYLVEVRQNHAHLVPADWLKVMSTKQVVRFRPPTVDSLYKQLCQLRETLTIESEKAWALFLRSCLQDCIILRQVVNGLAELDCLLSLAKVANQSGFVRPTFVTEELRIEIKDGSHPVISSLLGEHQQFVSNDTMLTENETRCMIITGPNMGGKSSYIKQVALICLMAQIGSYVSAESATLSVLDAIYMRMGASDDITSGRSTFMQELEETSEILRTRTNKSLVILDELGRGTATHDGTAIAYATLEYLITEVGCFTLFVTHYPLLGEFQDKYTNIVANFHMAFLYSENNEEYSSCESEKESRNSEGNVEDKNAQNIQEITFLYKLVRGLAARSYGLNVARLANIPQSILASASSKSREFELDTIRKRLIRGLVKTGTHCSREESMFQELSIL